MSRLASPKADVDHVPFPLDRDDIHHMTPACIALFGSNVATRCDGGVDAAAGAHDREA